ARNCAFASWRQARASRPSRTSASARRRPADAPVSVLEDVAALHQACIAFPQECGYKLPLEYSGRRAAERPPVRAAEHPIGAMPMTSPSRCPFLTRLCVLLLSSGVALAAGLPARTPLPAERYVEHLLVADAPPPGHLRHLQRQATHISARRQYRATQADCESRRHDYVSYDPANYHTAPKV